MLRSCSNFRHLCCNSAKFLRRCIIFTGLSLLLINKSKNPVFLQDFHSGTDSGIQILQFCSIIGHTERRTPVKPDDDPEAPDARYADEPDYERRLPSGSLRLIPHAITSSPSCSHTAQLCHLSRSHSCTVALLHPSLSLCCVTYSISPAHSCPG